MGRLKEILKESLPRTLKLIQKAFMHMSGLKQRLGMQWDH
jgi:hypothetical protein